MLGPRGAVACTTADRTGEDERKGRTMSPKDVSSDSGSAQGWLTPGRIAVGVVVVLVIVFICVNTNDVTIRVLIPEVTMPLWSALAAMFLIGLGCGGYLFRRRKQ